MHHSRVLIVTGVLKGFDQLLNLVLDDVEELLQGDLLSPHTCDPVLTRPKIQTRIQKHGS